MEMWVFVTSRVSLQRFLEQNSFSLQHRTTMNDPDLLYAGKAFSSKRKVVIAMDETTVWLDLDYRCLGHTGAVSGSDLFCTMVACSLCDVLWSCTVSLLNESTVGIDACSILFGLLFSQSQDVLQTIERHLHDLWVHHCQQVTHGFNRIQRHQIPVHTRKDVNI